MANNRLFIFYTKFKKLYEVIIVENSCKHKPKNLFARHFVCKHCGKKIVSKNKIPIAIACIASVIINLLIRYYFFEDPNLIINVFTFLIITIFCLILGWICLLFVGFKEKLNS